MESDVGNGWLAADRAPKGEKLRRIYDNARSGERPIAVPLQRLHLAGAAVNGRRNMDISNLGQPFAQAGGLVDTIGRFVGGNREATQKTLNAAIPTAMYAIADHGSSQVGARSLLEGLQSGQAPQLELSDLGSTLSNPQASEQLLTTSGGFLEKLLGSKLGGMLGGLSSFGRPPAWVARRRWQGTTPRRVGPKTVAWRWCSHRADDDESTDCGSSMKGRRTQCNFFGC